MNQVLRCFMESVLMIVPGATRIIHMDHTHRSHWKLSWISAGHENYQMFQVVLMMTTSTWSSCFTQNLPQSDHGSAFLFPRLETFDHASYLYWYPWRMAAVVSSRQDGWSGGWAGRCPREQHVLDSCDSSFLYPAPSITDVPQQQPEQNRRFSAIAAVKRKMKRFSELICWLLMLHFSAPSCCSVIPWQWQCLKVQR